MFQNVNQVKSWQRPKNYDKQHGNPEMTKEIKHHLLHIKIGAPMFWIKYGIYCRYNKDAEQAHEEGKVKLHYSWLLILISFVIWLDPSDYHPLDLPVIFHGAKYQNLWEDK